MTGHELAAWIDRMKATHRLSQRELAMNLGLHEDSLSRMKRTGTTRTFDLACAAFAFGLLPGQEPAQPLRDAAKGRQVIARGGPGRVSFKGIAP